MPPISRGSAAALVVLFAVTLLWPSTVRAADGATLLEQQRYRLLLGVAQQRLADNPKDAEALEWLSAVQSASGEIDRAVESARRAVEAAPDSSEAHCQLADTLGDKAIKAGVLGGGAIFARQMRHELDRSIELDPRNVRCLRQSMGLYEMAPALIGGSKSKARKTLEKIYQISPAEGARAEAALLQMQKKPLPEIELRLRRAVEADPRYYRAIIDLVSILASDSYRRWAEVERFARQAIAADPDRAAAYAYLASACVHQQHWTELDAALDAAHRHVPEDAFPLYSAAVALLESNSDLARAEKYLRQYLTQQPEIGAPSPARAHWKLGLVLEKEGKLADAASELRAADAAHLSDPAFEKDLKRIGG
jgi:tetratricopeptide (TPR) repeat protein